MAHPPAPLSIPHAGMILRVPGATVTRSALSRKGGYHLGAVYDSGGSLVAQSLRSPDKYHAGDSHSLSAAFEGGRKAERRMARALYLGHAFTHFGHFLLETIPALYWAK